MTLPLFLSPGHGRHRNADGYVTVTNSRTYYLAHRELEIASNCPLRKKQYPFQSPFDSGLVSATSSASTNFSSTYTRKECTRYSYLPSVLRTSLGCDVVQAAEEICCYWSILLFVVNETESWPIAADIQTFYNSSHRTSLCLRLTRSTLLRRSLDQ